MTYLNINLKLEELTEAVLNSDMNTLMKSLAITVFNAYMEEERHQFIQAAPMNAPTSAKTIATATMNANGLYPSAPLYYKSHVRVLASLKPSSLNVTNATNRPSCFL